MEIERGERPGTQRKKQRKRLGPEERNRERGRTIKTTLIGHKKSKNLKTRFCR